MCQSPCCCSCPSTEGGAKGAVPVDSLRNKGWRGVWGCVRAQGQLGHRATGQSAKPKSAIGGGPWNYGATGQQHARQKSNGARGQQHNRATGQHTMLHTSGRIPLLHAIISVHLKSVHHLTHTCRIAPLGFASWSMLMSVRANGCGKNCGMRGKGRRSVGGKCENVVSEIQHTLSLLYHAGD